MVEHHIDKPVVFISHATSDADFANAVKNEIDKVFASGLNVFCTSSPGAIQVGHEWPAVSEILSVFSSDINYISVGLR